MHHFVVKLKKKFRLRRQGGIDPLTKILRTPLLVNATISSGVTVSLGAPGQIWSGALPVCLLSIKSEFPREHVPQLGSRLGEL